MHNSFRWSRDTIRRNSGPGQRVVSPCSCLPPGLLLPGNYTRFYILSATRNTTLPPPTCPIPGQTRCLIRLSSVSNDASRPPLILQLLAALALPVSRLDRRPQFESTQLFQDVYFVEVAREDTDHSERWILDIKRAIENVSTVGSEAELLGIW